jgi:hypothetical protein
MRVLRAGGRYLKGREQRLRVALGLVVVVAALGIILAASGDGASRWAGGAAALGVLPLVARIARRVASVRKGRLGERLVADLLHRLPDDYWLINDITLGRTRGNIDHVIIGPCGVVVIETKRLAGRVRCWGDEWSTRVTLLPCDPDAHARCRPVGCHRANSEAHAGRHLVGVVPIFPRIWSM